jgi:hypothetical protein
MDPVHGYEDWSKFIQECEAIEEMVMNTANCKHCGGEGDVWERDCTGDYTLVPCPDCLGLGVCMETEGPATRSCYNGVAPSAP